MTSVSPPRPERVGISIDWTTSFSEVSHQICPIICVTAVTKYDAQTCAHAQNLPQRVGDQIIGGAVLQLENTDGKPPPPIASNLEGYNVKRQIL